jgi:hypothetical protein
MKKFSITSDEFFTDLKEKTGFEGSVRELKEYTKRWLEDSFEKGSKDIPLTERIAFPCNEIPFLNKFSLEDCAYGNGQENYITTILDEIELMEIVFLWRKGKIEELFKMIDDEDSENKI